MIEEDRLGAFLDGELDAAEAAEIERLAQDDPGLRERLAALRAQDDLLRRSVNSTVGDEIPDRFRQIIEAGPQPSARAANDNRMLFRVGGAMAASLALGLLIGSQALQPRNGDPVADALEQTASGQSVQLASGERLTPELTFARDGGGWCRQFRLDHDGSTKAGLACRTDRWTVEALVPQQGTPDTTGYSTAGAGDNPVIDDAASTLRGGDPLSADDEKALISGEWVAPKR